MIREATKDDVDDIWKIFKLVITSGDTYVFKPETPKRDLEQHWFAETMWTFVLETDQKIVGSYILKANQLGLGSHIANASYMVHPDEQGKGYGKALCKHSLGKAKEMGFFAMQFNLIVSSNQTAIDLWKKLGFEMIGTAPKAFNHKTLGYIDAHIMYKEL